MEWTTLWNAQESRRLVLAMGKSNMSPAFSSSMLVALDSLQEKFPQEAEQLEAALVGQALFSLLFTSITEERDGWGPDFRPERLDVLQAALDAGPFGVHAGYSPLHAIVIDTTLSPEERITKIRTWLRTKGVTP